eukprot:7654462-Heterocapsa_arctica.AAC.1
MWGGRPRPYNILRARPSRAAGRELVRALSCIQLRFIESRASRRGHWTSNRAASRSPRERKSVRVLRRERTALQLRLLRTFQMVSAGEQ